MTSWPCAVATALSVAAAPAVLFNASGATADTKLSTAAFPFAFNDTSLQGETAGPQEAEQQRLAALNGQLQALLTQSGCCTLVDLRPVAQQAHSLDIRTCRGCDIDLARRLGARLAVTGWVQKVSSLILNINLVARDVASGKVIEAGSVDIRGNTDEAWSRGLTYLLHDRLHPSSWQ